MATVLQDSSPATRQLAAAINDVKAQIGAGSSFHLDAYEAPIASANASSLATSVTLANEVLAVYNLHVADLLAHKAAGTASTSPVATDLASAIVIANDIKSKYNTHRASTSFHYNADSTNTITSADATDQSSVNTLLNELKTDVNAHMASAPAAHSLRLVNG